MMMVCETYPEIDIKEAAGQYEFSTVPRMAPCFTVPQRAP